MPGRCACTVQFTEKTLQKRLTKGGAAGIITHVAGHELNMWGISSAGSPVGIKTHPQSDSPATINSQQKTPSKRFASWILWGISSAGRALAWHARGHQFDPGILHNPGKDGHKSILIFLSESVPCIHKYPPLSSCSDRAQTGRGTIRIRTKPRAGSARAKKTAIGRKKNAITSNTGQ